MSNLLILTRHNQVLLEAECRAQPFYRGWCINVTQTRNDCRASESCLVRHSYFRPSSCSLTTRQMPTPRRKSRLHTVHSNRALNDSWDFGAAEKAEVQLSPILASISPVED